MIITTFHSESYKECKIYYRNIGTHWEYLTCINNEVYTSHIEVRPTLFNRVLFFLRIEPNRYSTQQKTNIIKYLKRFAQTTIDYILK